MYPVAVRTVDVVQEDEAVRRLVQEFGCKRWSLIASHVKGRLGKQCRERFVT